MSFKFFRKHEKVMLWIIVVITVFTFSIFSVTSTMQACFRNTAKTDVGDYTLPDGTFKKIGRERYNEVFQFLRRLNRDSFNPDQVVPHIILYEVARRAGIKVSDEELSQAVKSFFGAGVTPDQYKMIIRNYFDFPSPRAFEEALREVMAVSKVKQFYLLGDDCYLTEDVYEKYKIENEMFKVEYVSFKAGDYAGTVKAGDVGEKDLEDYYGKLRAGFCREEYIVPEKFSFDFGYVKLAGADLGAFADLTKDMTVDKKRLEAYYERVKERFRLPGEKAGEKAEKKEGDETGRKDAEKPEKPEKQEKPEKDAENETSPEPRYKPLEEVSGLLEKELALCDLLSKAKKEWDEFVTEREKKKKDEEKKTKDEGGDEGKKKETGGEEPEAGGVLPDGDAFFKDLCTKYRLAFERTENPVSWADLDKMDLFGSEEFKRSVKLLAEDRSILVSPERQGGDVVFLARVRKKIPVAKKDFKEVRDLVLEDYLKMKRMDAAFKSARELREELEKRARALPDLQPEIEKIAAENEKGAADMIEKKKADKDFTKEDAEKIREQWKRKAEALTKRFLDDHLYRVFGDLCAEKGLEPVAIDAFSKAEARNPKSSEKEEGAVRFIKANPLIPRSKKNAVLMPLRDEKDAACYVVHIVDRFFPPPEQMTQADIEDGRRRIEMNKMIEQYRKRQQGGSMEDPRFTKEGIEETFRVHLYNKEEEGGEKKK